MKVHYRTTSQPPMIDQEWRSAACDENARLRVVVEQATPLGPWVAQSVITVPSENADAERLTDVACTEIKFVADAANTHPIYVGDELVESATGQDMNAREVEIIARVSNANEFYVIAANGHADQKLRYFTR